jgi:hypothetical protein
VNRDTLIGGVGDFGSLNRFGYVEGMVSSDIDPTGYANDFFNAYEKKNEESQRAIKSELCSDDPSSYKCFSGHLIANFMKVSLVCADVAGFSSEDPTDFITKKFKYVKKFNSVVTNNKKVGTLFENFVEGKIMNKLGKNYHFETQESILYKGKNYIPDFSVYNKNNQKVFIGDAKTSPKIGLSPQARAFIMEAKNTLDKKIIYYTPDGKSKISKNLLNEASANGIRIIQQAVR